MWKSILQTEIALSTMEAEYVALSTAMKDILPIISAWYKNFGVQLASRTMSFPTYIAKCTKTMLAH
jgi:hypothetical protein